ncbi:N-6 DNA methylase [bacterium]|nr:N-6 DNA methylase [bacterium]
MTSRRRSISRLARHAIGKLGPESIAWQRWQQNAESFDWESLQRFDRSMESAESVDRLAIGYISAIARTTLLDDVQKESLSEVPWFDGYSHPDWGSLDRWGASGAEQSAREALASIGWFDADPLERADTDLPSLLQESLLRSVQKKRAGEFYTPDWLADRLVEEVWQTSARWLDPTSGGGTFARAVARHARLRGEPIPIFVGLDQSSFGVLATSAAIASTQRTAGVPASIRVGLNDLLQEGASSDIEERFDRLVGNPPWLLWDTFASLDRELMADLWDRYGLRIEKGMASILGGGKRDVAFLLLLRSMDRWLRMDGRSAFVVPQSLFKSTASGRGLRQWGQPDGTPLRVDLVEDLSRLRPFPNVAVKTVLVYFTQGRPTLYPVPYRVWRSIDGQRIDHAMARPSDDRDPLSHWRHDMVDAGLSKDPLIAEEDREGTDLWGACDYQARLGVNVGGASGVYWMSRQHIVDDNLWRMNNLFDRGRQPVTSCEVDLEASHLYPILLGKDIRPWRAIPSAWILMLQDPRARRGWSMEELRLAAPRALAYVARFEDRLRERAAFKRFFQRPGPQGTRVDVGPYYSMFNVGPETMMPIKVVWNRMGRRLAAAVVTTQEGKPILPQETHCFTPADSIEEADYLAAILNSPSVVDGLERMHVVSSKSLATPRVIHSLRLSRFEENRPLHRTLARLGQQARQAQEQGEPMPTLWEEEFREQSFVYWRKSLSG